MTFHVVGYKIKCGNYTIRLCSGFIETCIFLWYYRNIRKLNVIAEEFFVRESCLP